VLGLLRRCLGLHNHPHLMTHLRVLLLWLCLLRCSCTVSIC
jgi:hypothetical protein